MITVICDKSGSLLASRKSCLLSLANVSCSLLFFQALQTEVNSHQAEIVAVGVLGHSIEGLIRGPEFERGKTINQRYDELCTNISVYQAKLQSALTTSQNFKDGLDAAIKALNELKKQLDKLPPVSRNLVELRNQAQQFKVLKHYAFSDWL